MFTTRSVVKAAAKLQARRGFANVADPNAAPTYTPSILERLLSSSRMPRVPLDQSFPGLPALTQSESVAESQIARISTLPSGIRVATLPATSPISSVGVFVDAGSRYESPENNGITHFVEMMSLKSTSNRSDFRLVRDMLKLGANVSASSGREHIIYSADCLNEHVPQVLATLGDVIQNNVFDEQELQEAVHYYEQASIEREKMSELRMMESIHEAAYNNTGLGLSLYAPTHNLHSFNRDALKSYVRHFFTPKRMVVSAVGVEHEKLIALTQEIFGGLPADVAELTKQPAQYTGGEIRMHRRDNDGLTHVALAFETASWHSKDLVPMCVLQMMMGGGGSFSAGGPGKGMYSRLYSNVLNKYDWAESCTSFNSIFTDSSLFGIYGTSVPDKAKNLVDVMTKEFIRMSGPVDAQELSRAKAQLKSAVYMQLESRLLKLEDIGRQVITYGKVESAAEIAKQIDAVTPADVQRVAQSMLATPVSIAAAGDLTNLPRYEQIQRSFKN